MQAIVIVCKSDWLCVVPRSGARATGCAYCFCLCVDYCGSGFGWAPMLYVIVIAKSLMILCIVENQL